MSSNSVGTIFRIFFIALTLICAWLVVIGVLYYVFSLVFSIEFNIKIFLGLFCLLILFRMFYPKNVFNCD